MQEDDPWALTPTASKTDVIAQTPHDPMHYALDRITDVTPLDGTTDETVPAALWPAVFGPLPQSPDAAAPASFAILDAAKITNLPQMLEGSRLPHQCLFQGKALEDLGDAAPWIVALEDNNRFVRGLFTQSSAPWDVWDTDGGVILRSYEDLNSLRTHFRKFTKVRDETDTWMFFRFWEPSWVERLAEVLDPSQLHALLKGVEAFGAKSGEDFVILRPT
ncbi:DUF4123 domain-containing protein [Ascidiaceihabitans sp.]|uniref:DUF4123 domain-containing protein n=1 Tax=Ascidiaceihabitans sp. TaxID=1872644 RepID=UPI0032992754